jgi:hypothetical protein
MTYVWKVSELILPRTSCLNYCPSKRKEKKRKQAYEITIMFGVSAPINV